MNNFSKIIFDLDGTLTDNTKGIGNSLKYALKKMNVDGFDGTVPKQFIGPPLKWGFKNLFGLDDERADLAMVYFREYYSVNGIYENIPYSGVEVMLQQLNDKGKPLFIATSKFEKFAWKICEHLNFDKYITYLKGECNKEENETKSVIISELLKVQKIKPSKDVVMIGDTVFDICGGKDNGLSTIAVLYGFGKKEELLNANPDFIVESVEELVDILNF